jgi:hypothetical protein
MQNPKLHQTAGRPLAPTTPRRYRRMVLLVAGTLALVLATIGIVAALGGRSSPATQAQQPSVKAARSSTIPVANSSGTSTGLSTTSTAAGHVLADGTYPTYIREVDAQGATITVDVIQVFHDEAAIKAAIEDGKPPREAQYLYVYIRNQNPLLRTLPVARDVRIEFVDACEAPPNRHAALTELAKETTPFNSTYYYDVTVSDGAIHHITQQLSIPAC